MYLILLEELSLEYLGVLKMITKAPLVLFVYNRPEHTLRTIEALKKNHSATDSVLYIFSDAPKDFKAEDNVKKVRDYIKTITGFKQVIITLAHTNMGLAESVISGVTNVITREGKVIVLEDDLITSTNFIDYMNEALETFISDKKIWSISAHNISIKIPKDYHSHIYMSYRASSWGWATWKDRWLKNDWDLLDYLDFKNNRKQQILFNRGGPDLSVMLKKQMEGKIDSWAIRWCYNQFKFNAYTVYPIHSKVLNIGMDGSGVHCEINTDINIRELDNGSIKTELFTGLKMDKRIIKRFKKYYSPKTFKGKIGVFLRNIGLYDIVKRFYLK